MICLHTRVRIHTRTRTRAHEFEPKESGESVGRRATSHHAPVFRRGGAMPIATLPRLPSYESMGNHESRAYPVVGRPALPLLSFGSSSSATA